MKYYKIYKNNEVVDVNNRFFLTKLPYGSIYECEVDKAHLIMDSKTETFYRTNWLPQPLVTPHVFEYVQSELISEEEYNELRARLDEGVQPIVIREEYQEPEEEPKEKVFSLSEVKDLISQMTEHINKLESELNDLKRGNN